MRINQPVTGREAAFPADLMLVSTTDEQGRITHCNAAFVAVSGYDYDELMGQPHNIVRHPDMPPAAFKDMWATIGRGRPWSGVVKNRCKNGDHYWVLANVTPVVRNGKAIGYMSVRLKPSAEQVQAAEALYAQMRSDRPEAATWKLHAGSIRRVGWRDWPNRVYRLSMTARLAAMMAVWVALVSGLILSGVGGAYAPAVQVAALVLGSLACLMWFKQTVARSIDDCTDVAAQIAGCNLQGDVSYDMRHPIGRLIRNVRLVNLNMQAIVDDVRAEVSGMTTAAKEIAQGSMDLAQRTEEQSANVEKTASAMEQITSVVQQTASTAHRVEVTGQSARSTAVQGGESVGDLVDTMRSVDAASQRVSEVIGVIESIAFQTNILALNAAVEAARAGDQGRGFAVVAAEVRALANRSSEAAKEIRALIRDSVQQVEQGSTRVTSAADVIQKVVRSVDDVTAMMQEITSATREQSKGVGEVNLAIGEIEQATQQNAALAEETAAACESLQTRASTLTRAVQIFRTVH